MNALNILLVLFFISTNALANLDSNPIVNSEVKPLLSEENNDFLNPEVDGKNSFVDPVVNAIEPVFDSEEIYEKIENSVENVVEQVDENDVESIAEEPVVERVEELVDENVIESIAENVLEPVVEKVKESVDENAVETVTENVLEHDAEKTSDQIEENQVERLKKVDPVFKLTEEPEKFSYTIDKTDPLYVAALNHQNSARLSLSGSTWPLDHGDAARSKYILDAGFPASIHSLLSTLPDTSVIPNEGGWSDIFDTTPEEIDLQLKNGEILSVISNTKMLGVQWVYTAGENSEYLYLIVGDGFNGYSVLKLFSETLEILQTFKLSRALYTGGLLMHKNKHVYNIHSNRLTIFYNGDLTNYKTINLIPVTNYTSQYSTLYDSLLAFFNPNSPSISYASDKNSNPNEHFLLKLADQINQNPSLKSFKFITKALEILTNTNSKENYNDLNDGVVMTNGMLVTQDGYLVVKQWSSTLLDTLLLASAKPSFFKLTFVILILSFLVISYIRSKKDKKDESFISSILSLTITSTLSLLTTFTIYSIMMMVITTSILGPFNYVRLLTDYIISPIHGGSSIKIVDPNTLEIVSSITLPERCSYARMALKSIKRINYQGREIDEDIIILLGDENVHQLRWNVQKKDIFLVPSWSRRYRKWSDGSFPGTGPSIYNDHAFFTDSTFPVLIGPDTYTKHSINIFNTLDTKINNMNTPRLKNGLFDYSRVFPQDYTPSTKYEEIPIDDSHLFSSKELIFPPSTTLDHYLFLKRLNLPTTEDSILLPSLASLSPSEKLKKENELKAKQNESPIEKFLSASTIFDFIIKTFGLKKYNSQGGFMFWSVTILPFINDFINKSKSLLPGGSIVWDTSNGRVSLHQFGEVNKVKWVKHNVFNSDCITTTPDNNLIFMSTYKNNYPTKTQGWLPAVTGSAKRYRNSVKDLLIVDSQTGRTLARKRLPEGPGVHPSLLVPGKNNDLFLGTPFGILRVFYDENKIKKD